MPPFLQFSNQMYYDISSAYDGQECPVVEFKTPRLDENKLSQLYRGASSQPHVVLNLLYFGQNVCVPLSSGSGLVADPTGLSVPVST